MSNDSYLRWTEENQIKYDQLMKRRQKILQSHLNGDWTEEGEKELEGIRKQLEAGDELRFGLPYWWIGENEVRRVVRQELNRWGLLNFTRGISGLSETQ